MRDEIKDMSPFTKTVLALLGALLLWKFFGVGEWLKFFFTIVLFPFAFLGFCVVAMMYAPEAANDGYEAFCRTFEAIREKAQERAQQVEEALSEVLPSEEESA
jgi:hypothetical protein